MRIILLLLLPTLLAAQTVPFDANYRFTDGVYLSHATLLANQPDIGWEVIAGEIVQLPNDYRVQVAGFGYKNKAANSKPYAICLDGMLYLFVRHDPNRDFYEFAGLRSRGPYSTIQYDTTVHTRQLMKAYNPATGQPFREGWVERDRVRTLYRIIDFNNGRRLTFDRPTVMRLVSSEEDLVSALELTASDETEKLRQALKIYGQRQPLQLPVRPANR